MKKLTISLLFAFLIASTIFGGIVQIEDSDNSSTGLCSFNGSLKAYSGASNGYAINISNSTAQGITWKVEVSNAGTYTLTWRYVNGGTSSATTAKLIINGITVNSAVSFPKTSDKSTFILTSTTAALIKGVNEIRIETTASSEFADIDWIEISGNTIGAADCSAAIGSGGDDTTIDVTGISVSPTNTSISTSGGTTQLSALIAPLNATNQSINWSSNNTSVATISNSGLVTAIANGNAIITVTTVDGGFTAVSSIVVNIGTTPISVTGVSVSPTSLSVNIGATTTLTSTIAPSNATNTAVSWTSSNTAIATVNGSGVVTGVALGSATITVTTVDGGKTASAIITVTEVISTPCSNPVASSMPFTKDGAGEYCFSTSGTITYINSWNTDLIEVNGVAFTNTFANSMPAAINGMYYIHYKATVAWAHLEVTGTNGTIVAVTGVSVTPTSTTITTANGTLQLAASVSPSNATNKSVSWVSNNTSVATVSSTGLVTGLTNGTATITVTTVDGSKTASSAIIVNISTIVVPVTGVSVSPTSSTITTSGGTVQLAATVAPSNATNKTVTWTSSNSIVATVSSTGLVTGKANGTATITVTTTDGTKTASSTITVNITTIVPVTGVSVSPTSSTITVTDGTIQLTATIAPTNATNKIVTWTSGNTSVATVSSTGLVTGKVNGTTTITVTTSDGAKTATSAITVSINTLPPTDMIGYATVSGGTTGGAGGTAITISTLAQLQAWVTSRENNTNPEIVYINTKISSSSDLVLTIKHGANISIYGVGTSGELQNVGLNIRDYKNVIVRNMKLHEVFYPNDALTIDACEHVWVDHCELYSKIGSGITVDTYDGLLDIKNGSIYVTVSWNYLHNHMKCSLIGHTDNSSQQAIDSPMRITYHHNWFSYTDGRNPSIRFGAIHIFNNYFEEITDYGLAARDGAHAKVENCVYNNVKLSMSTDKFPVSGFPNGYICQTGNSFTGTTGAPIISQTGCDFWNSTTLPYSYSLDATSSVISIVKANTGIGKVTNLKAAALAGVVVPLNENLANDFEIDVYPNPFKGSANISFTLTETSNATIKLFDLSGRQVDLIANEIFLAGENEIYYNNSGLNSGMYILSIESGSITNQTKLIVE